MKIIFQYFANNEKIKVWEFFKISQKNIKHVWLFGITKEKNFNYVWVVFSFKILFRYSNKIEFDKVPFLLYSQASIILDSGTFQNSWI
ncbi:hypothetical protein BC751_2310 [Cecembia calidifontis]|uniref:Uncharacterized protein n=1 Tax=Cecembia calidifontis TaxID=1187080 RepID=A0A4Q7P9C5_9BACT|nr:hypothetical protein BC751_2310 [Cecembia calidifontis]